MSVAALNTDLFQPLRQLLESELQAAGLEVSVTGDTANAAGFMRWYLRAIQALEAHVASGDEHAPMARREVELQCRCALTGASLAEAVELLARFADLLYPRAGQISLELSGDQALFKLDSLRRQTTTASDMVDITGLFAFHQLLQWLAGRELPLRQVRAGPTRRDDVLPFLKLFRAPVLSGGSDYALVFERSVLAWPVVRTAAEFPRFFELFPCAVFLPTRHSLSAQVAILFSAMLTRGQPLPTQAELARELGKSVSAFRQQLRQEGSGFRQLRERALAEAAATGLARGQDVAAVAAQLGFADAGSFRRAFRQWYGCAPRQWQAEKA